MRIDQTRFSQILTRRFLTIKNNAARNVVYKDLCDPDLDLNLFLPKPTPGTS